ncbi:glycosyltransferase (plasmid) [Sphingopyxis indica]|uniref:glycosyltransferase n=1 Tax=Sphingopyxis indica TaxID=436663 RepID=UPI002938DE2C|nr:glycosyltransferase [Sphingopyxis indica]WOF45603.1 glycosyltransferase [Sphingopyxis indica]
MIFAYWFPPANAIGSSRPAAMARYFAARGWKVSVVAGASEAVPPTFAADLSGFEVDYVRDGWLTRLSSFRADRGALAQRLSTAVRLLSWPDHVWPVARAMRRCALATIGKEGAPDIVLSTALPFSVHGAARAVARASGALFVADNRDIWAHNPYKWSARLYKPLEPRHERAMLGAADLVVAVSDGMTAQYAANYPELADRLLTVMNGVDPGEAAPPHRRDPGRLRLVYTGILYGDRRDVTPLLRAADSLGLPVAIDFYGSEPEVVRQIAHDFPRLAIADRGRVARGEALAAQAQADAAILVVGTDAWEDTLLPGKLFEYAGSGRPIIALANPGSDSGRLVARHELGIATTDEAEIAAFLSRLADRGIATRREIPAALTRDSQLRLLETRLAAMRARP